MDLSGMAVPAAHASWPPIASPPIRRAAWGSGWRLSAKPLPGTRQSYLARSRPRRCSGEPGATARDHTRSASRGFSVGSGSWQRRPCHRARGSRSPAPCCSCRVRAAQSASRSRRNFPSDPPATCLCSSVAPLIRHEDSAFIRTPNEVDAFSDFLVRVRGATCLSVPSWSAVGHPLPNAGRCCPR